jgi:hypothetical protein
LPPGLALARGADEADEQRVPVARRRQEFRMRLAGQEPRMRIRGSSTISTSRSSIDLAEITRPASSSWVR